MGPTNRGHSFIFRDAGVSSISSITSWHFWDSPALVSKPPHHLVTSWPEHFPKTNFCGFSCGGFFFSCKFLKGPPPQCHVSPQEIDGLIRGSLRDNDGLKGGGTLRFPWFFVCIGVVSWCVALEFLKMSWWKLPTSILDRFNQPWCK